MSKELDRSKTWIDKPPTLLPGFEADFIRELDHLVANLPENVAQLRLSRVPGHPDWPEPFFEVIPTNPRAARIEGTLVIKDLSLTIEEARREFIGFARGGRIWRGASWQEELRWIWQVTVAGGFTQRHYLDSSGKVIGCAAKLTANGKELVFRNGRRAERLLGRSRLRTVTYEPYL
jgi:hypothetical protein